MIISVCLVSLYWKKRTTYNNSSVKVYLIPAFILKMLGWVFSIAILIFYFNGFGDTIGVYYLQVSILREIFEENSLQAFKYIFIGANYIDNTHFNISPYLLGSSGTIQVIKVGLLFSYFCFNSFLLISLIFTLVGFWGSWQMFLIFNRIKPNITKQLAICFLFLPSMIIWGTGMMKEPLVFFAMAFLISGFYVVFIKGPRKVTAYASLIFGAWLLLTTKSYIFLSLAPALLIWAIYFKVKNIKDTRLKLVLVPVSAGFLIIGLVSVSSIVASVSKQLAIDNLVENVENRMDFWQENNSYGSSYSLPTINLTPKGIASAMPRLFTTGLLRPFIWESKKPIIFFTALETFAILILTFFVFLKIGILKTLKRIFSDPLLLGLLTFSLIFFPLVALTSGNFGTLVRYKLPCLPFYLMMLAIVYHDSKVEKRIKN